MKTLLFVIVLCGAPSLAGASCMVPPPPCEHFWRMPLVFTGRVTAITSLSDNPHGPSRVKFAIAEMFRGVDTPDVDIHLRGGSNDPRFEVGGMYMVYAYHREAGPGWTTSICVRTAPAGQAAEDIAYARLSSDAKGTSRIVGRVMRQDLEIRSPGDYRSTRAPVAGVRVTAKGPDGTLQTVTAEDGTYQLPASAGRAYDVSFISPPGLLVAGNKQVWIPDYRACAGADGYARYDGRVAGVLRDGSGNPVPHFPVTLGASPPVAMGGFELHVFTDESGRFEFAGVQPASYEIAPSRALWRDGRALPPLTRERIPVAPAGRSDAGTLTLPVSLRTTLIEGVVLDPDGKPAAGAKVSVAQPDIYHTLWEGVRTGEDGRFAISLIAGRRYAITATHQWLDGKGSVYLSAKQQILAAGLVRIELRLARPR